MKLLINLRVANNPKSKYIMRFLIIVFSIGDLSRVWREVEGKSTIEPCMSSDSCSAMVGYTVYTDLKVSQVALLFNVDPIQLLAANSFNFSSPEVEDAILPSNLRINVPVKCFCADGIHKAFADYSASPSQDIATIARLIYGGLVTERQIRDANSLDDSGILNGATKITIPLPCTCFNKTDSGLPTMYLSYVVNGDDKVSSIASKYFTTTVDIMAVNSMGSDFISPGDILAVPLSACSSEFSELAEDYGTLVANGTYMVMAGRCVQCSCGPGSRNLYCIPSFLSVSCSSMHCRRSTLTLGNTTEFPGAAGCSVTSCGYYGLVNASIYTRLSTSLQPRCPGVQKLPVLADTKSLHSPGPAPASSHGGGGEGYVISPSKPPTPSRPANAPLAAASAPSASGSREAKRKPVCILFAPFLLLAL